MTALISAKGLTKRYGRFHAVDDISFDINAGRIVGLVGPNGAGKSTTLKAILGLIRYSGELRVIGRDPRQARKRKNRELCLIAAGKSRCRGIFKLRRTRRTANRRVSI